MNEDNPFVCVIDDESSMRESLRNLLRSAGLKVQAFASAQEFLTSWPLAGLRCLVLDVHLPGMSGLDLQQKLADGDAQIPIIFMTGYGDIRQSVRAMKAGAIEFLTKPFRDEELLNAINQAIERGAELRSETSFSEIVGKSTALRQVLREVDLVAPSDASVLILGETGTGKERKTFLFWRCTSSTYR